MNISAFHKRLFYVNSGSRLEGTDSSFLYKIEVPKESDFDSVCLMDIVIPKSYYLVRSGFNTFILREIGVNTVITIPVGNYSRLSFKVALPGILNAASPNGWVYSMSISNSTLQADTGKYTYTVTNNGVNQPSFICTSNVFEQLGFSENSTNVFVANSIVSTNILKFQLEDQLFLHSDICNNGIDSVLQEIYVSGEGNFSNIRYQCYEIEPYSKKLRSNANNVFKFSLCNEAGQLIDLNGLNLCFTLLLYKKNNVSELIRHAIQLNALNHK
jgi:hypothetical protein